METEQNNDKLETSQPQRKQSETLGWLVEQVTILAEAMGEAMTPARLKIYAGDLADLDCPQLETAFARARRELKFFPKIAELRELAGAAAKDERNVEAEAAWQWANNYLGKWGIDLMPVYSGGKQTEAPAIPSRIAYALRRIGGLSGLNQITADNRAFLFKDFCEAYNLAPIADSIAPQLAGKFPITEGQVKQLSDGANEQREINAVVPTVKKAAFPQSLATDEQRRSQHERLKAQAAELLRRKAAQGHSERNDTPQSGSDNQVRIQARANG